MSSRITPFLMFVGQAEEAMQLYTSVFSDAEIEQIERYGAGEPGAEGTVKQAVFRLGDQRFRCIDSPAVHAFGFTPSFSLFVDCETEGEVDRIFELLSADGTILMTLDAYPFSARFAWVNDRFGVSWQINLAAS